MPADEFELIARHFAPLARGESGALGLLDDAAVVAPPPGRSVVVTTDTMVEGVHFLAALPAEAAGARLLRVNLSDLASMGAEPAAYTVALTLPRDMAAAERESWVEGFARGLAADQREFGLTLVGGDTVSAPGPLSLTLTALGWIEPGREMRRSAARAGDTVFVSGTIGDAALGLLAERGDLPPLPAGRRAALIERFRRPVPRVQAGRRLAGIAHAAADVSDGLVADLGHICDASGVSADISAADIPLSDAARAVLADEPALMGTVLTGGDDYELVFTAPPAAAGAVAAIAADIGVPLSAIGSVRKQGPSGRPRVHVNGPDGRAVDLADGGFRHF